MVGTTVLGKYRLLRSLGSGNNAEVFLAEPIRFPEYRVVVKRIHPRVVEHPKFRQLFEGEVRSMSDFDHPYAVGLVEASLDEPIGPCLIMEYVPGITLEELLLKEKRLDPHRLGRLLGYFCHALYHAHRAGIIHRDLKPANLMVVQPGTVGEWLKVMDFGFAGFAAKPHFQLAELTGEGAIYAIGTPAYVSPEMIRGDRVDTRSDLYSVGIILFEALTGWLPFNFASQDRLLRAHARDAPPRFDKLGCAFIPQAVEAVVQDALTKYPNERPQTARDLADAYGRALGVDYWATTAPQGWEPLQSLADTPPPVLHNSVNPQTVVTDEPFRVIHEFQIHIPEPMAAAKIRGFVQDFHAEVVTSDPGLIRLRVGMPPRPADLKKQSGLLGWFTATRAPAVQKGQEPVEVEFHLDRPDPARPLLHVLLTFKPVKEFPPIDHKAWHARCEKLNTLLRQYLGA